MKESVDVYMLVFTPIILLIVSCACVCGCVGVWVGVRAHARVCMGICARNTGLHEDEELNSIVMLCEANDF